MTEPVLVTCPTCGASLKAPAAVVGKTVTCPKCQEPLRVPYPATGPKPPGPADLVAAVARALADAEAARDKDDQTAAAGHLRAARRAAETLVAADAGAAGCLARGLVGARAGNLDAAAADFGRAVRHGPDALAAPEVSALVDGCASYYEAVTFMTDAPGLPTPPGRDAVVAALRKVLVLADRVVPEPGTKARELVASVRPLAVASALVECPACREGLKGYVARCPHCTTVLTWMDCPDCKRKVATRVTQKFVGVARGGYQPVYNCLRCGKKLAGPGCFIATAAYGTGLEPEVDVLRQFRDRVLLRSLVGRAAVAAYYATSPPIAASIRHRSTARAVVRGLLRPVVWGARVALRGRA